MERSSIFDMIGPVMIGPSSSHTAGVVRIGKVARKLLQTAPTFVTITFYNSFATTYEGHGSDRAVMAGLLDYGTDDERIREALEISKQANIDFKFKSVMSASTMHPNTIKIQASSPEKELEIIGVSRGGGLIQIKEVDGFACNFTAQQHTLVILADDVKGSIAFIADIVAHDECNIATMTVARKAKNDFAKLVLEMDSGISPTALQYLNNLKWVHEVVYIPDVNL